MGKHHWKAGGGAPKGLAAAVLLTLSTQAGAQNGYWESPQSLDRWSAHITEASTRFGIPGEWVRRVMRAESGGRTMLEGRPITSRAGAMGLMQLMPGTWTEMRNVHRLGRDPHDPRDNILAGAAYLRAMYDQFGYPGLFAAYNAGPARYAEYLATAGAFRRRPSLMSPRSAHSARPFGSASQETAERRRLRRARQFPTASGRGGSAARRAELAVREAEHGFRGRGVTLHAPAPGRRRTASCGALAETGSTAAELLTGPPSGALPCLPSSREERGLMRRAPMARRRLNVQCPNSSVSPTSLEAQSREIVERLGGAWQRNGGMCRCPAHDDRTPS